MAKVNKESPISRKSIDVLKNITVKSAKNLTKSKGKKVKTSKKVAQGSSQDFIPVKNIHNGLITTYDNRYVSIIEVLPTNFYKVSHTERRRMVSCFGSIFNNGPAKISMKIMSDVSNANNQIRVVQRECKNQTDEKVKETLEDYCNHLKFLCSSGAVSKRYFIIIEYEGKSKVPNEIYNALEEQTKSIISTLKDSGNYAVTSENMTMQVAETLYTFFNRNTSQTESFSQRFERIQQDYDIYNGLAEKPKAFTYADFLAPKGIHITSRNNIYMDGTYYGFIGIKGSTIPNNVLWGWLDYFDYGSTVDVDVIMKKLPKEATKLLLKQYNKSTKQSLYSTQIKGKVDKHTRLSEKYSNNTFVKQCMDKGDDLYETAIILTLRANTERQLGGNIRLVKKSLSNDGILVDTGFDCCEDYMKMTMPLLNITTPFKRITREILSSNLGTMYPFTAYEINDPNGFLIGINTGNKSLAATNNFNTDYYTNGNMLILGGSGSGKTFAEQHIAEGMLMHGIRCYFIIPKKGYEYKNGCKNVNGTYLSPVPGSHDCMNIMAIRPEGKIDISVLTDDVVRQNGSLLSKKIMNITVWLQLLLGNEILTRQESALINTELKKLYSKFGITEDDSSIYEDITTLKLKIMPIISEMQEQFKQTGKLDRICEVLDVFVNGSCSNMNGQTNVDLDNNYIVFDIDEDKIPKDLLASYLYLAFEFVYSSVKETPGEKDAVFLDEVWKMMQNDGCAEQVQNMIKLIRGYGGCTVIATQELEDFLKAKGGFGSSVLNNSELTILLKMKPIGLDLVKQHMRLTEEDYEDILKIKKGYGMLFTNDCKIEVRMIASDREFNAFNTDPNYIGKYVHQNIKL